MERTLLLLFVVAVLLIGGAAGWAVLVTNNRDNWSPRDYVVKDGGCIVYPQGDPLYDAHYASNVNLPNCKALKLQEQAQYIEKQSAQVEWDTTTGKIGVYTILGVFVSIFVLLGVAVWKGGTT